MDHKPITIEEIGFTLILFSTILGAILFFYRVMGNPQEQRVLDNREENKQEIVINYSGPRLMPWAKNQIVQCIGDLGTVNNVRINYIEN